MDIQTTLKLVAVAIIILLIAYFLLNAVLTFINQFSDQLKKITKNGLILAGVAYIICLIVDPYYTVELSEPVIRLVKKIVPDFLDV